MKTASATVPAPGLEARRSRAAGPRSRARGAVRLAARVAGPRRLGPKDVVAWFARDGARALSLGEDAWTLERATVEIVRLVPGKRLTARCALSLAGPGRSQRSTSVIAKQYARRDLAARLAHHLGSMHEPNARPGLRLPRLLGLDPARGIVFMEELPGRSLDDSLDAPGAGRALAAAGALLATFHGATVLVAKRVTRAGELERTRECADSIARSLPGLRARLDRLTGALARTPWGAGEAGRSSALLHGSFRPNHLLLDGGTLGLVDLESLRRGPAAYDIANWIAALHYREIERRITAAARRRAVKQLLRGYRSAGGRESCARVLWLAASLLVQKQIAKVASRPGRRPRARAAALLGRAEEMAALIGMSSLRSSDKSSLRSSDKSSLRSSGMSSLRSGRAGGLARLEEILP